MPAAVSTKKRNGVHGPHVVRQTRRRGRTPAAYTERVSVRRKLVWLTLCGLAAAAGAIVLLTPVAARPSRIPRALVSPAPPRVFAHRGGAGEGPEATIPTMRAVIERDPQVGIELDVRRTRDEQIVVIHDGSVDRTGSV